MKTCHNVNEVPKVIKDIYWEIKFVKILTVQKNVKMCFPNFYRLYNFCTKKLSVMVRLHVLCCVDGKQHRKGFMDITMYEFLWSVFLKLHVLRVFSNFMF